MNTVAPAPASYTLTPGRTPLLISLPHAGTELPADQQQRYTARALRVEDTDWHLQRLYAFAHELGAGLIVPRYSRYLIDLNRPDSNLPMYAGQNNTGLCPLVHFTGEPIYRSPDAAPDAAEVARRTQHYGQPYHAALQAETQRLRALHGHAVLFDAHSIASRLPWLFEGRLPHLNLGSADGRSCSPGLGRAAVAVLAAQDRYSHVVDGRFKGGHITRHFGRPDQGVHAVQLEMCWRAYMDEDAADPAEGWSDARADAVTPLLRRLVRALADWRPA